ncbi:MAG: PadR family transcriptional regulator [Anaerolineae bacterium]
MRGRHGRGPGHGRGRGRGRAAHLLEPALLCSLLNGPAHGYALAEAVAAFSLEQVSLRRIYRMLSDMEEMGWVVSEWETENTQGPPRRVYALTPAGEQVLAGWMTYLRESRDAIDRLIAAYERGGAYPTGSR